MSTPQSVEMTLPTKYEARRDIRWQRWRDEYALVKADIAEDTRTLEQFGADWMDSGEADDVRTRRDRRFLRLAWVLAKLPLLLLRDLLSYPFSLLASSLGWRARGKRRYESY